MANTRFVVSTRSLKADGSFGTEPGETSFLRVPVQARSYHRRHVVADRSEWRAMVADAADGTQDDAVTGMTGNVLVFVHGYNNTIEDVLERTALLQDTLAAEGWRGVVVPFDWPSANSTLNYLEDREDAASVAGRIVKEVLPLLVEAQAERDAAGRARCTVNVHLLGHSTGAFVIMEAFAFAEKVGGLFRADYRIGQVGFIGADVAAASLDADSAWAGPLFRRVDRLTNYVNGYDSVLAVSNAKRLGTAPRVGRVGLTPAAHAKCVDVDCAAYFETRDPDRSRFVGTFCHSWHIGDTLWARDFAMTLDGKIDRNVIPTRELAAGRLRLKPGGAPRPKHQDRWEIARPGK